MTAGSFQEGWLSPSGGWDANAQALDALADAAADRAGLPRWVAGRKKNVPPLCKYFVTCVNPAEGTIKHPLLGEVLACRACLDVVGLESDLVPFPEAG